MSESDSDYCDVGNSVDEGDNVVRNGMRKARTNDEGVKVRGTDVEWVEVVTFKNKEAFDESDIKAKLDKQFSRRKSRAFDYGDVDNFVCKYSRKVGFLTCPLKYKVTFMSGSFDVCVEVNDDKEEHLHEEKTGDSLDDAKHFRWSEEQTAIITENLSNNVTKPNWIRRNLNNANVFGSIKPSDIQLYNKIANVKKTLFSSEKVVNTHDLRQVASTYLDVPEDELEGYVALCDIDDEKEDEAPRFTLVFSTPKNLSKLTSDKVLQTDATYRLNWNGFPVFVVGNDKFIYIKISRS